MEDEEFFDSRSQVEIPDGIDRLSPDWSDFVMTQFTEDELVNINEDGTRQAPNVAGLRRITELLMGDIVNSRVIKLDVREDYRAAYAIYEVSILTPNGHVTFSDGADYTPNNGTPFFKDGNPIDFATACVVTRAEARALRKALKLRVVAAEEVEKTYRKKSSDRDASPATSAQLNYMNRGFSKKDIDGLKFIKKVTGGNGELTYESAKEVLEELQKYVNGETVPKSLKGYKENWEN